MSNFTLHPLSDCSRTSQMYCVQSRAVDVYHQSLPPQQKVVLPVSVMQLEAAKSALIYAFHISQLPCFLPGFPRYCFFLTHCGHRPQELSTLSGLLISAFLSELLSLNPYSAQQSELLKAEMRESCFSTLSPSFASEYL